jgi:hypothetical protein
MPLSLDDIIRTNRQHLAIRLATEKEVMVLRHAITPDREPDMDTGEWRVVALGVPQFFD